MTRVAYIDPIGGLAGDMLLAALLDAGAPREALDDAIDALGLDGVALDVSRPVRSGMRATHVDVRTPQARGRTGEQMREIVAGSRLTPAVRTRSLDALGRLISAEAGVHGVEPVDVVLHELGDDDTLVDICGAFALLDTLAIDRVVCAPIPLGRGIGAVDHGTMPLPAPATMGLLAGIPVVGVETRGELVTPTGAAIVVTAADGWGEIPAMVLRRVGTGVGTRTHADRPNVVRVTIGDASEQRGTGQAVVLLQANLDDLVPELVPDVLEACSAAGAIDAWTVPIQMKKARPGVMLSVLGRPSDERTLAETLLRHSSSLGVRVQRLERYELDRAFREVDIDGHAVRVKIGLLDGSVVNVAPEHDDCAAVAASTGRPVKQIWAEALAAATANQERDDAHAR
ncbi:MAG TPA: nickel pincer cofactor biosynthesis protein LarC [Actinomycetota bacterium]|nr:nickel pincer cofactor biosynthesis protein LarC [Actinomycetota bacterium]